MLLATNIKVWLHQSSIICLLRNIPSRRQH